MRLLIVRHGDPDYSIDSLTPKGWKEAEYLSQRLVKEKIDHFYVSPLGRARDTAAPTLDKLGRTAEVCDWLREFPAVIQRPDHPDKVAWDWLPADWAGQDIFYDARRWYEHPIMAEGRVGEQYLAVTGQFDELLARHGYRRTGPLYAAERPNDETICFFCHFGLEVVLLSRLLNVSPMPLWHGTCAAPSSVSTLYTEERRPGIASFRMASFGDISHLYAQGEPPAFAARFCELYTNTHERHD